MPLGSPLTRRGLLTAAGGLGLGALLAACGADGGSDASGDAWSFTDDRGEKVTAPRTPERIVAFAGSAAALHDLGLADKLVGVFGPTTTADGGKDPQAGNLDLSKVESLGNAWGEFNIEAYAALKPELLVSNMFIPGTLWYVPDESKDKILPLAPYVGITSAEVSWEQPIKRYTELAAALGADLNADPVTSAKARYDAAVEAVRTAVADNPGIKVLACSGDPDLFYASNPAKSCDLIFFQELGVELIVPDALDEQGFFESLSWENADKYAADLLLLDDRAAAMQPDELAEKPAWAALPAVVAGQVTPWSSEPIYSYAGCAPLLERLAGAIAGATKTG